MKDQKLRQYISMAMLAALAYVLMVFIRIPVVAAAPYLKYEPKDIIITIGGFMYGPLAAFMISLVVSIVEMFTVSDTGMIGAVMNIVSSCAFAFTASLVYKKIHMLRGAVLGLITGVIVMMGMMTLWNYWLTPIYMSDTKEGIAAMRSYVGGALLTVYIPFNALKGGINAAITMMIYKPVVMALRKAHLVPQSSAAPVSGKKKALTTVFTILGALLVLAVCVFFALILSGKIDPQQLFSKQQ